MLISIKQWETKYLRDFDVVKSGEITEERLYNTLTAMFYVYVSTNGIEPFTISFGKGNGFCINANSHVGVIVYDDITLYIMSMIPDLSLGKILYLQAQGESVESASTTRQVVDNNLNDEESISAIDYFIISLLNTVEDIKQNGMISILQEVEDTSDRITGKINFREQLAKNPAFDSFHVSKTIVCVDNPLNQVIKLALNKSKELTALNWIIPIIDDTETFFAEVTSIEDVDSSDFPNVKDYTSMRREDYEKAILFSKYILKGFDPFEGSDPSFFPEFMLDMNVVFEYYVTRSLERIFKSGFSVKRQFTLGVGPEDIPIEKKNIELDGYYESPDGNIVIDTKNKYKSVLDRDIPDFIAANPDIYQQYYYASRLNSSDIILVYPSSKTRNEPIGKYELNFKNNKNVDMYFWGLQITSTPKENKRALIRLAKYMEELLKKRNE